MGVGKLAPNGKFFVGALPLYVARNAKHYAATVGRGLSWRWILVLVLLLSQIRPPERHWHVYLIRDMIIIVLLTIWIQIITEN